MKYKKPVEIDWFKECDFCMCSKKCIYKKDTQEYVQKIQEMYMDRMCIGKVEYHCSYFFVEAETLEEDTEQLKKEVRRNKQRKKKLLEAHKNERRKQ
uniref:Phage protein n=1 Tax=Dulem virus 36 TaxID=3145754 RepID=A0AAU8AZH4_9CAUD